MGNLEELMSCYLQGDSQAGEELLLYPQHQQRVERIARKNTKGTSIFWEDAAQEAHEKVLLALKNRRFNTGGVREFYCWAAAVAYHKIIDLVRQEKRKHGWNYTSLDQQIPGTDMLLGETVADDCDLWDAVERADLILKAVEAIATIDQRYPNKGYLKLWRSRVEDRTQSQLATEMGITQGEVSKRWKELLELIAQELGLLQMKDVKRNLEATRKQKVLRRRSDTHW